MESTDLAATLYQTKNGAFLANALVLVGATLALLGLARGFQLAEIGFIGFDDLALAAHWLRVHIFHGFADTVRQKPSRLVGDAQGAVQLMGRIAFLGR